MRRPQSLFAKAAISAGCLVLLILLGWADYLTGTEIAWSVFYLLPVGLAAWYVNWQVGIGASALSTFAWYLADTLPRTQPYSHPLIPVWNATTRLIVFMGVTVLLTTLRDTLQRESEYARVDYLTNAMNGRAFYEAMGVEMAALSRYGRPFTVLYLDVDNLKEINDRRGHSTGDKVLRLTVDTMKRRLRQGDAVARLGGDEFAVLLRQATEEGGRIVAERLQNSFHDSLTREWGVTFSLGALTCQRSPASADEVIEQVDALMYEAKRSGKNAIRVGTFVGMEAASGTEGNGRVQSVKQSYPTGGTKA